jgi:hypothetical protein
LSDHDRALSAANDFDAKVEADAKKISDDYSGIVALSIRQALGASEVTISKAGDGSWNISDVLYFMKGMYNNYLISPLLTCKKKSLVMA